MTINYEIRKRMKMKKLRDAVRARLQQRKAALKAPDPMPRYDEVFAAGVEALDADRGHDISWPGWMNRPVAHGVSWSPEANTAYEQGAWDAIAELLEMKRQGGSAARLLTIEAAIERIAVRTDMPSPKQLRPKRQAK